MSARNFLFPRRRIVIIVLVALMLLAGLAFAREYLRNREVASERARMERENAQLEEQHLALLALLEQQATESAVEKQARTKLNLAKPGEVVYVVREEGEDLAENVAEHTLAADSSIPNPLKWFYYFFAPHMHIADTDI